LKVVVFPCFSIFFFGTQHVVILTDYTQRCWLALIWSACSFMPSEKIIVHVIWFRKKKTTYAQRTFTLSKMQSAFSSTCPHLCPHF
jgi:hypothetical protein